jgi:Tfp pilus assembly protein PilF
MRLATILVLSIALLEGQPAEETLKKAIALHQSGDFRGAIQLYRKYIEIHPDSPDVLSNFGAALAHEGQYAEAIAEYEKALKLQPENPTARANLGLALYKTGQIADARNKLEQALVLMQTNQQVAFLVADCDIQLGDYKRAIALLGPWETRMPDDAGLNYLLGTALIRDGQTERGSQVIDRILRRGDSAEARLLMGTAKLSARDYAGARGDFEEAIKLNPKLLEAHASLGLSLASVGDYEGAAQAYHAELALDPLNFTATFQLGMLAVRDLHPDQARTWFNHSLVLRPGDVGARYEVATLDLTAGKLDQARGALEQLVKESPSFTAAHVNLATIYYRLKRKEDGDRERAIVRQLTAEVQAKEPGVK